MNTPDHGRVRCPRCGAEYGSQPPGGVCPSCAFGEALSPPSAEGGASRLRLEDIPVPAGQGAAAKEAVANPAKTILVSGLVEEQPGSRVGHYKLLQQIGEGGCGVVCRSATASDQTRALYRISPESRKPRLSH